MTKKELMRDYLKNIENADYFLKNKYKLVVNFLLSLTIASLIVGLVSCFFLIYDPKKYHFVVNVIENFGELSLFIPFVGFFLLFCLSKIIVKTIKVRQYKNKFHNTIVFQYKRIYSKKDKKAFEKLEKEKNIKRLILFLEDETYNMYYILSNYASFFGEIEKTKESEESEESQEIEESEETQKELERDSVVDSDEDKELIDSLRFVDIKNEDIKQEDLEFGKAIKPTNNLLKELDDI